MLRAKDPELAEEWTVEARNRSVELREWPREVLAHHTRMRSKYEPGRVPPVGASCARPAGASPAVRLAVYPAAEGAFATGRMLVRRGCRTAVLAGCHR